MELDTILEEMLELQNDKDKEATHARADQLLIQTIRAPRLVNDFIWTERIIEAWLRLEKWYG